MKSAVKHKKQAETDTTAEPQTKEREGLTLAEKACNQYFDTDTTRRTIEPELIVCEIRSIIGANALVEANTPTRPSDQLARILGTVRFDEDTKVSERVALSLDEAIEACFLHSDAYRLALEIYRLDLAGQIVGFGSAFDALQVTLERAKGGDVK
jgi:hypothetical protein